MKDKIYSLIEAYKFLYKSEDAVFESDDKNHRLDKSRFCIDWQCGNAVKAVSLEGLGDVKEWRLI